jgi:hypothetical protein
VANLKRTRNKLLKNGYLPNCQVSENLIRTRTVETWIDTYHRGTPISFYIADGNIDGAFKVHGARPDRPEVDEFNSDFTRSISEAIGLSRAGILEANIQ